MPNHISKLPDDILRKIFCKLPVTTLIFKCQYVCKSWRDNILLSPEFANLHLSTVEPGSLLLCPHDSDIYWIEFRGISSLVFNEEMRVTMRHPSEPTNHGKYFNLVNSCNGLLCIFYRHKREYFDVEVLILNPITGEYINLPPCNNGTTVKMSCLYPGLGFSSKSKQFKVIRMYYQEKGFGGARITKAKVHTLGTTNWRDIDDDDDDVGLDMHRGFFQDGLANDSFVNGCLHWFTRTNRGNVFKYEICAFDFENEQFRSMSVPVGYLERKDRRTNIGVFENRSIYLCSCSRSHDLVIWVMKEYRVVESWTKTVVLRSKIAGTLKLDDWCYARVVKMLENGDTILCYDRQEWIGGGGGGEIGFLQSGGLFRCDLREGRHTRLDGVGARLCVLPIVHTPRFDSLEDIIYNAVEEGGSSMILNAKSSRQLCQNKKRKCMLESDLRNDIESTARD